MCPCWSARATNSNPSWLSVNAPSSIFRGTRDNLSVEKLKFFFATSQREQSLTLYFCCRSFLFLCCCSEIGARFIFIFTSFCSHVWIMDAFLVYTFFRRKAYYALFNGQWFFVNMINILALWTQLVLDHFVSRHTRIMYPNIPNTRISSRYLLSLNLSIHECFLLRLIPPN